MGRGRSSHAACRIRTLIRKGTATHVSNAWLIWWLLLCGASVLNVAGWLVCARTIARPVAHVSAADRALRSQLLWLSAVYVLGCGFRSFLPMIDIPRLCLHSTWVSRIFIGRSVATIAELCFIAQWALLLHHAATATGDRFAMLVSRALVPLIVAAEVCSWTAVLTTNNLLHAIENSLWTLAAALALTALVPLRSRLDARGRRFVVAASACGAMYLAFMGAHDVPMWLARWRADLAASHAYLPALAGLRTALQRCIVDRHWSAWREDVPWLSLYFTLAVWVSIALAHVPPLRGVFEPAHPGAREKR